MRSALLSTVDEKIGILGRALGVWAKFLKNQLYINNEHCSGVLVNE